MVASSGASTTVAGCVSCLLSWKISLTSNHFLSVLRSRPLRILFAAIFSLVIVSPAGVVFAVVWTKPYLSTTATQADVAPIGPVHVLPAPDVQSGSLPATATNVYA